MKIAVLLTCFNRKIVTKTCLQNLFRQELPQNHELEVFLCDDGSKDGTADLIKNEISNSTILYGKGNLWWAGALQKGINWLKKNANNEYNTPQTLRIFTNKFENFMGIK